MQNHFVGVKATTLSHVACKAIICSIVQSPGLNCYGTASCWKGDNAGISENDRMRRTGDYKRGSYGSCKICSSNCDI